MADIFERLPFSSRDEWLKMRGKGIGGSDVSALFDCGFKTAIELYHDKISNNHEESSSVNDSEVIQYGHNAEDYIRELFKLKYKNLKVTHTDELLVRLDKPYLRASLDGEIEVLESFEFSTSDKQTIMLEKGMRGVLEIKTSLLPSKDEWVDSIPQKYYCQTLHYLNVTNYDFVIVVVEMRYAALALTKYFGFLAKDKAMDLQLVEKTVDDFWNNNVIPKKEPDLRITI